jgi:two-component system NarL family sensor kinase
MPDKQLFALAITGGLILLLLSLCIISLFIYLRYRHNKYYSDKESMQHELHHFKFENERLMNQVAREVHDNVSQTIGVVKMHIYEIERLSTDEQQLDSIQKATSLLQRIIKDAEAISHSLNSDFIKTTSLVTLLDNELYRFCPAAKIDFEVIFVGNVDAIESEKKLLIYRIAQDAIRNIIQHSCATAIHVTLKCEVNSFTMIIADNGCGIPKERLHANYGVGINNMLERAKFLNGQLNINSKEGDGCTVTLLAEGVNFGS